MKKIETEKRKLVSVFKHRFSETPDDHLTVGEIAEWIKKDPALLEIRTRIRSYMEDETISEEEKLERLDRAKKNLPSVTFSGKFSKNGSDFLETGSGMIVLDFDKIGTDEDVKKAKDLLIEKSDPVLVFISPSGRGLKAVYRVSIDEKLDYRVQHKAYFDYLTSYFKNEMNLKNDTSGSNLNRMCFMNSDPEVYFKENTQEFKLLEDFQVFEPKHNGAENNGRDGVEFGEALSTRKFTIETKEELLKEIVSYLNKEQRTITPNWEQWSRVGYALYNELGERGREWFHRFSKRDSIYDETNVDKQYNKCRKLENGCRMGTILHYAKETKFNIESLDRGLKKKSNLLLAEEKLATEKIEIRFNLLFKALEYRIHDSKWEPIQDRLVDKIYLFVLNRMFHRKDVIALLYSIAIPYDPIQYFIDNLPDIDPEIDYIKELSHSLQSTNATVTEEALRLWFVGFIRNLLDPSYVNELVPILIGSQSLGKTRWTLGLIPGEWENYLVSQNLDPTNKDHLKLLGTNFWVIMDELSTILTRRASTEAFKAMISTREHTIRLPYDKFESRFQRHASIIGTSNEEEYLRDLTGNRRFISIKLLGIDLKRQAQVDIMKVYRQAYEIYKTDKERAGVMEARTRERFEKHNKSFEVTNSHEYFIQKYFRKVEPSDAHCYKATSTQLIEVINQSEEKPIIDYSHSSHFGKLLRKNDFGEPEFTRIDGKTGRWYRVNPTDIVKNNLIAGLHHVEIIREKAKGNSAGLF